jgi:ABC-2 type transport system permease protein
MRSAVKLYGHYISINIRSIMQYKMSFLLTAIGQFLVSFNVFLGLFFMFERFSNIKGFTYSEILLCFSIMLMEFSLAELAARGFDSFSSIIRYGEFDRIMVRPRSEILQILGSRFELTRIGRMFQAIVMFIYGIINSGIDWSISKVLTVIFMLMGGTALFSGIFLVYAALCFFTLEGLEFINVFTDGAREYGKYPIGIYGKRMLQFCTFIVPYALVQYYPLLYLLGRKTNIFYVIIPLFAFLFLIPCYILWRYGVKHYKSSGS